MGSMTSISIICCLLARSRLRKYPTGYASTRQMIVASAASSRLRPKTEAYRPMLVRLARVTWPSLLVRAYHTTMPSGTTINRTIHTRYGAAAQREALERSIPSHLLAGHDVNFIRANVHADQLARLAGLGGVDQPFFAFHVNVHFKMHALEDHLAHKAGQLAGGRRNDIHVLRADNHLHRLARLKAAVHAGKFLPAKADKEVFFP